MVSQQLLEELKIIIKDECGKDLEMKEVVQIANGLVGYFDLLAKINYRLDQDSANKEMPQTIKKTAKTEKQSPLHLKKKIGYSNNR
jgi:hypothetical protein